MAETKDVLVEVEATIRTADSLKRRSEWADAIMVCELDEDGTPQQLDTITLDQVRSLAARCRESEAERDAIDAQLEAVCATLPTCCEPSASVADNVRRVVEMRQEQAFKAGFLVCQRAIYIPDSDCVRIDANADEQWESYRASEQRV